MADNEQFSGVEVVAAASTLYTSKKEPRFELALEGAENWRNQNIPLVVVDSSAAFNDGATWVADALTKRGALVLEANEPGIATQRIQAIQAGISGGAEKVISLEPEKTEMAKFAGEISQALNRHAILVIGRTAAAEATLPSVQLHTERLAGWTLEQTHDFPADALSGGRGFTAEGVEVLSQYPASDPAFNNWIYLYRTPLEAREQGLSIGGIKVDLLHPDSMTKQEQNDPAFDRKRYNQFKLQLDYLLTRSDVDPVARPIADAILAAMSGLTAESSNAEFEEQIDRLEDRLAVFGYRYE